MEIKARRRAILLGLFAISILTVYFTDVWLVTCGFDGCPSPRAIQNFQPDQGGRILDRYNRVMGRLELVRRVNVPLSSVPEFVQQAFIATEDRRFYQHGGLDWRGFARALVTNLRAGRTREGFSTITMQVARNFFLTRERTLTRKLREVLLAYKIEANLTVPRIPLHQIRPENHKIAAQILTHSGQCVGGESVGLRQRKITLHPGHVFA